MNGRVLAIGDIHGCSTALNSLLQVVQITSQDTVIVLGDLIDRGPDSRAVLETLIQLAAEVNLIAIRGNHEEMLLQSLERSTPRLMWIAAGAKATLESYGGGLEAIPQHHIDFVTSMQRYWETESHIFVHANVDPDVEMEDQVEVWLRWHSLTGEEVRHCSGKTVVCGHTSLKNGRPAYTDGFVCIDTKAYAGEWLTCLDVKNQLIWQGNQQGESRGPAPLLEIGLPFSETSF